MLFYTSELKNYNIDATDGELGKIKDLYFEENSWAIHYASIDTRKWLPGRKVLLSPSSFIQVNEKDKKLEVDYDKETIRNSPDVPEDSSVSGENKRRIDEYYGWGSNLSDPVLYGGGQIATVNVRTPPEPDTAEGIPDPDEPEHDLRSEEDTIGFRVHANNGRLGNVADFIYDEEFWKIAYVVVESRDSTLIPKYYVYGTEKVDATDWLEGDLYINGSVDMLTQEMPYENKEDIVSNLLR
ncbi:PRC-barrel domain-containing protein [Oceanobacillus damuensis]|uniref:PRC-barrel domain-containing protein n=1 Tax=Oceanobacillus damuensis TaxID=937928 RepID=UPI0008342595|nr:PRC-barrel domain-containing protein [Oceanobacillus damuensis]